MSDFRKTFYVNFEGLTGLIVFCLFLLICWWVLSFFFGFFTMSVGRLISYLVVFGIGYVIGDSR